MKKIGINLVKLAVGLAFSLMVIGCLSNKSVSRIGFDYFDQFKNDDERLVYITSERRIWEIEDDFWEFLKTGINHFNAIAGTPIEKFWDFSNLYIFTDEDDFEKILNKLNLFEKTAPNIIEINNALLPYAPVIIANNKLQGKGIGVFKLPKGECKILYLFHVGGKSNDWFLQWAIITLENDKDIVLMFETAYNTLTRKYDGVIFREPFRRLDDEEPYNEEQDNEIIRKWFNSCDGIYGLYNRSGSKDRNKTQPGFIEVK